MNLDTKKKICFIVPSVGTARSFLKEPIRYLSNDFDVYLVSNIAESDDLSDMLLAGYKSIPIERRLNLVVDFKALSMLLAYFREMNFDSVHSLTKKSSLLTTIAGRLARVPYRLHHFTGQVWATMKGIKRFVHKRIDDFIVWSDTHMLVDGFSQLEYLQKEGILKIGQATVLANGSICGVNTERFCKNEAVRNKIRNKLNISEDSVVFIFLGRLKREKGIYELFEAFNDIVSTCYNAKLLLVGADEESCIDSLHKYKNLKINDNVVYYGATPKPEELYNSADIYVLPTYREGFGLSILEASSVGLPVITTDTYGVRDSIIEGTTGLRCKTQDVKSLSECMTILYGDKEQREKLGQNGVNYVQEKFTIQTVCEAWLNYYLNVVK